MGEETSRLMDVDILRGYISLYCNESDYLDLEDKFIKWFIRSSLSRNAKCVGVRFFSFANYKTCTSSGSFYYNHFMENMDRKDLYRVCKMILYKKILKVASVLVGFEGDFTYKMYDQSYCLIYGESRNYEYICEKYLLSNKNIIAQGLRDIFKEFSFGFYTKEDIDMYNKLELEREEEMIKRYNEENSENATRFKIEWIKVNDTKKSFIKNQLGWLFYILKSL